MGFVWKLVFLGTLAVGGYFIWLKGPAIWSRVRLNSDVESASTYFIRQMPRSLPNEAELKRWVQISADDKLKTHLAFKARWYVAYGPRGDELKVIRDDEFLPRDKEFFARSVDDARRGTELPGVETERLEFPRGTMTRTVSVDNTLWVVVAGWTEELKDKK